ncbi:MAG: DUF2510 domain-containing protein [Coriobacteriales bacterium]|jgi:hypothetical protein|nr:DUF2510 domain-containing protein [Coriobacteriales bacterium]
MEIPAGWYPDPAGDTTKIRYWNGQAWTDQTQPAINPELQVGTGGVEQTLNTAIPQVQQSPQVQQQTQQVQQVNAPLQPIYAPGQEPPAYSTASQDTDRKGLAVASLVLGIVGILSCCLGWVGLIPGAIAVVLGILSVKSSKKGMAIAGIICGAVAVVLGILGIFLTILGYDVMQNPTKYGLPPDIFENYNF